MPLTRHFYDLDEVESALAYCIIEQRQLEACFWLLELIDSDETDRGLRVMVEVYLVRFGVRHIVWLLHAYDLCNGYTEANVANVLSLCCALTSFKVGDTSFLSNLIVNTQDIKRPEIVSGVGPRPRPGLNAAERFFGRSIAQGRIRAALWSARYCRESKIIEILNTFVYPETRKAMEALRTLSTWSNLNYGPRAQLLLCIMMATKTEPLESINLDVSSFISGKVSEWIAITGRRSRRCYTVPSSCLYLSTRRGLLERTQSTMIDLHQLGAGFKETYEVTTGCRFWDQLWLRYGITENGYEIIGEQVFVDDIPDEWSAEDRLKSHGPGLINPGEPLWWRRWLRKYIDTTGLSHVIEKMEICVPRTQIWTISAFIKQLDNMIQVHPMDDEIDAEFYPVSKNDILPDIGQLRV